MSQQTSQGQFFSDLWSNEIGMASVAVGQCVKRALSLLRSTTDAGVSMVGRIYTDFMPGIQNRRGSIRIKDAYVWKGCARGRFLIRRN